ncbi:MAG: c-type cytochrome [Phycisphaerales bacterium]|nr:c-type cytochrome [Phycisphaerales bacterium]
MSNDSNGSAYVRPFAPAGKVHSGPGTFQAVGIALGVTVAGVALWAGGWAVGVASARWWSPQPRVRMHAALVNAPAGPMLEFAAATRGREVFAMTCAACHGPSGMGVTGLGASLVESDFVFGRSDESLVAFIAQGRPIDDPANVTKVLMPPRGGNPELTDDDLASVVQYLRGLQDPRRMPELGALVLTVKPPSEQDQAEALEAAGGDAELAMYIASGKALYKQTCSACHGVDAMGLAGNGKPLVNNTFIQGLDEDALFDFIMKGRDPGDPLNTTGVGMPARGGNPALSEDDILDIIAFLRTLQGGPSSDASQGG